MGQDYEFRVRVNEIEEDKYCLEAEMFKNGSIKRLELMLPIGGCSGAYSFPEKEGSKLIYHCRGNPDRIDKIVSELKEIAIPRVEWVLDYCNEEIGKYSHIFVHNNSKGKVRAPGIHGGGARNHLVNSKRIPIR